MDYDQNDTPNSPEITGSNAVLRREFLDADHWLELAKELPYTLPRWNIPCSIEAMELWLDRANLTRTKYQEMTGTTLEHFMQKNPTWPLRAFVGLLLELGTWKA